MESTLSRFRSVHKGFVKHMDEWLLLMVGVLCHIAGIYCMRLAGEWHEYSTYSSAEVCGFIFGTLFFAVSIPCIIYTLKSIFWMKYPVITLIWIYLSFAILSILGFILSCFTFNGYVYFVWNTTTNLSPVITLTSLISMALCLLFTVICLIHLFRVYATRSVRVKLSKRMSHFEVPDGFTSLTETTALLPTNAGFNSQHSEQSIDTDNEWLDEEEKRDTHSVVDTRKYIPTSYKSDMNCYRGDSAFCLFVWIAVPIFFFMCTLLPMDFSLFLPMNIAILEEDGVKSYEIRVYLTKYKPGYGVSGYGLNIYPDLLIYYVIFMLVCNISYLSRKSLWFRIEMRKIRFLLPRCGLVIKQGEWLLWSVCLIFFILWALYWVCIYDGYGNVLSDYKWLQRVALGMGKIAMLALSLALFPITKSSNIWNTVFHTSYEHMIRFHKFFSYAFLLCAGVHLFLWLVYFGLSGQLSTNLIFATLPYTYDKRDFTIPALYYVFLLFILPIFGVCAAVTRVRRWKYEIFYYSHIVGAFLCVTMVVWHAKSSWYYVVPPLILYTIDQLMIMWKSTRIAHVTGVRQLHDQRYVELSVSIDEIFKSEIYEAQMDIYNKSLADKDQKLFVFGQYFWLNIPSVSAYQWHPITCVDSNLSKSECTFIIQKRGKARKDFELNNHNLEWCDQVCDTTKECSFENKMMELKLDGPYGEPIIIDAYRKILIVVGGVGFVSYISFFEYMLKRAIRDETQISVDLVWLSKSPKIYLSFKSVLREYAARFDNDPERLFDIRLFYTQRIQSSEVSEIQLSLGKLSLEYAPGRPNLIKELSYIEGLGTFTLIMASGPASLLQATQKVAVRYGAHYRQESFVL